MSTTSLLSNHNKESAKQSSVLSNRSNFGSLKNSSINRIDNCSSMKKFSVGNLTDEDKLRRFHTLWEENKIQISQKINKDIENFPFLNKSTLNIDSKIDVLTVPEYSDEIFLNERNKDKLNIKIKNAQPKKFWMANPNYMIDQPDINEKMRRILVDWLLKVHSKFKLLPETLYLTVNILDRYLSQEKITRKILQLVGVTAMHIACKYEEIYPPESNDFVYITDNAYSKKDLLETEYKMLKLLNFNLTFVSSYRHLERLCAATDNNTLFTAANKYMDLTLVEYGMIKHEPGTIAAGALYLSHAVEKRKYQKQAHQTSTHSLGSSHTKSQEYSTDLSSILLAKLSKESGVSENDIKKLAIDINVHTRSKK
mmetsp:Transcript_29971/g.26538  ORF Transcript_29971/g.26538 Transcript_29971/m.26538 type:complete len:368 (+) Transcript_29971:666-1769(+)